MIWSFIEQTQELKIKSEYIFLSKAGIYTFPISDDLRFKFVFFLLQLIYIETITTLFIKINKFLMDYKDIY